jgi:type IV secretory pathway VirB2 component (pilin)
MLISCLGILGLVICMTNTRVKEIGVRKVLGATVVQIAVLLSAEFAKALAIACIIAIPIAWWEACEWSDNKMTIPAQSPHGTTPPNDPTQIVHRC